MLGNNYTFAIDGCRWFNPPKWGDAYDVVSVTQSIVLDCARDGATLATVSSKNPKTGEFDKPFTVELYYRILEDCTPEMHVHAAGPVDALFIVCLFDEVTAYNREQY